MNSDCVKQYARSENASAHNRLAKQVGALGNGDPTIAVGK
jgi:hypothetical protein